MSHWLLPSLLLLVVVRAPAQMGDEEQYARDYERDYEHGFTDDSAKKHERAMEIVEMVAALENLTLEAVYNSATAFIAAHAVVIITIACFVRDSLVLTPQSCLKTGCKPLGVRR